jgi:hypothetical protein
MTKSCLLVLFTMLFLTACSSTPPEIGAAEQQPTAAVATVPADVLTGTWSGDWGPTPEHRNNVSLQLSLDGPSLTGTLNPGPSALPLSKASFDPGTGGIVMEAYTKAHDGTPLHYRIEGKIEGDNAMMGTWVHEKQKGDFKIVKN